MAPNNNFALKYNLHGRDVHNVFPVLHINNVIKEGPRTLMLTISMPVVAATLAEEVIFRQEVQWWDYLSLKCK